MAEVGEAGAYDVNSGEDGCEDQRERVHGGSGGLVADGDYGIVFCVGGVGESGLLFVDGEDGAVGGDAGAEVGRCDGGGVCWVCGVGAGCEEGDRDGEFGSEEER